MTYVADSLRLQGENKYIPIKFRDILHPAPVIDPMKIINDVVKRAGLVVE